VICATRSQTKKVRGKQYNRAGDVTTSTLQGARMQTCITDELHSQATRTSSQVQSDRAFNPRIERQWCSISFNLRAILLAQRPYIHLALQRSVILVVRT
jgi:hypothetical protein